MDIFFQDPDAIPLPPEEVRIKALRAEPYPDGRRVRIFMDLTPFQKRPSGEITVFTAAGDEAASLSIIETIDPHLELTIHLRGQVAGGAYRVEAVLFYLEEPQGEGGEAEVDLQDRAQQVVDRFEAEFTI